jgi:hypothetical protein
MVSWSHGLMVLPRGKTPAAIDGTVVGAIVRIRQVGEREHSTFAPPYHCSPNICVQRWFYFAINVSFTSDLARYNTALYTLNSNC